MEEKLDLILVRLDNLEKEIQEIKKDTRAVAKHVPFVDKLSQIGTLGAISSLNKALTYINPMYYIKNNNKTLLIKKE